MNKAIILVSGGLDSLITAAVAHKENDEVYFLHVNYGQNTEQKELESFHKICDFYKPKQSQVVNIGYLKSFGGSVLLDSRKMENGKWKMENDRSGNLRLPYSVSAELASVQSSMDNGKWKMENDCVTSYKLQDTSSFPASRGVHEVPGTYVPFRNGNLIAIATAYAETINANRIYIGAIEVDGSNYPDCRGVFFESLEKAINYGTRDECNIRIITPLLNLTKAEIVKLGYELKVPMLYSWSCYFDNDIACGICDSCILRLRAFKENGLTDPIPYRK